MKAIKLYLVLFLLTGIFWSCREDEISDESIFKNNKELTGFDKWLLENYTYPYNILFKYKMEDIQSSLSYHLVPADPDKCIAWAKLIKHLWLETLVECKDMDFPRQHVPRVIHLVGSGAYNSNNTVILGTASEGMMITLYLINTLNPANPSTADLRDRMRTIFHEFGHILHQKKNYAPEFEAITNNDYILGEWGDAANTLQIANQLGFVSRYARSEPNEDFVEIIARYVIYGPAAWDAVLRAAGTTGAAKLTQKLDIVRDYLNISWGIDIDELSRVFETRLSNIDKLDLTRL